MVKSFFLLGLLGLLGVQVSYAEPSESDLLNKYNDDPSLLLDPSTYVEAPVEEAPREEERAPASETVVPEMPSTAEMEIKIPEKAAEVAPAVKEPEPEKVVEVAPAVKEPEPEKVVEVAPAVKEPEPEKVVEAASVQAPEPLKPETAEPQKEMKTVKSEVEALPGVTDFSVILSGDQFFPSVIRMKQNGNKNRLLFVSTSSKPAALVFVKPRIQRWLSSQPEAKSVEEYREVTSSKVTEIEFDAEPGTYEYYDALSGARGEIKIE